ncbi:MAG: hypothetical protein KER_03037 [Kerstersia gyiorum]
MTPIDWKQHAADEADTRRWTEEAATVPMSPHGKWLTSYGARRLESRHKNLIDICQKHDLDDGLNNSSASR